MGKLVLRLTVGGLMIFHGIAKILHPASLDFIGKSLAAHGLPTQLAYGVYAGEIVAPLMLILGIYSRAGAVLIVINMIFAILLVHSGDILTLTKHGGWALELQAFYLLGALSIAFLGSGRFAIKPD